MRTNVGKKIMFNMYESAADAIRHGDSLGYINTYFAKRAIRKLLANGRLSPDEYVKYLFDVDVNHYISDLNEREILVIGLKICEAEEC